MLGLRTLIPLFATATLLVAPAEATTTYYTGATGGTQETAFNTAVGGLTLMDPGLTFSASDLAAGGLYNASGTGIDFLGFSDANASENFTVNSGKLIAANSAEQVTINLPPAGVYAFGIHISVVSSFGLWCVELTQGACNYSITNSSNSAANVQFFGFVSTTPITAPIYIRPSAFAPQLVLPDFEAYSAAASPVPEPHTMLLVGLGLIILPLIHLKIRRAS